MRALLCVCQNWASCQQSTEKGYECAPLKVHRSTMKATKGGPHVSFVAGPPTSFGENYTYRSGYKAAFCRILPRVALLLSQLLSKTMWNVI
jgi:hypothetical protein